MGSVLIVQVGLNVWNQTGELGGFTARSEDRYIPCPRTIHRAWGRCANSCLYKEHLKCLELLRTSK